MLAKLVSVLQPLLRFGLRVFVELEEEQSRVHGLFFIRVGLTMGVTQGLVDLHAVVMHIFGFVSGL